MTRMQTRRKFPPASFRGVRKREPGISLNNLEVPDRSASRPVRNDAHKTEDPMNIRSNPDTTLPAVTTGPLASSRKIFATPDAAHTLDLTGTGATPPPAPT